MNWIEMVSTSSEFSSEVRALYDLDCRKVRFNEGHNWDEDTEKILVGNRDELAMQRQTLTIDIWKTVVSGDVDEFLRFLNEDNDIGQKRGIFGETLLHICFLFGQGKSQKHHQIAQILIERHPELVNAEYDRQPYLGEAPLHMALTNRDEHMVRVLLKNNVNLQSQARGSFFRPSGKVYYGEYPLSFAACIGDRTLVKILIEAGADIAAQDTCLGNTVLHLLVIHEEAEMYEYILNLAHSFSPPPVQELHYGLESKTNAQKHSQFEKEKEQLDENITKGAKIDYSSSYHAGMIPLDRIPNGFRRTPLTLAAELAKTKMFMHLVNKSKEVLWSYGNIRAVAYPLDELDTYPDPSRHGNKGALELIVTHSSQQTSWGIADQNEERLKLLETTPINQLLQEKWSKFASFWFYIWGLFYVGFLVIFNIAVLCPRDAYYRQGLEVVVVIGAFLMVIFETIDIIHQKRTYFKEAGARLFYLISWGFAISILLALIFRFTMGDNSDAEAVVLSIASFCLWIFLFFFARGFKSIGYLIVMIREMLFGDIVRFLVIYIIFLFGYSTGMSILFQGTGIQSFSTLGWTMQALYQYFLADFPTIYQFPSSRVESMTFVIYYCYTVTATILLLNMLIAMLNNTFQKIQAKARLQWKIEWASIILLIERRIPPFIRNRHRSGKKGRELGFDNDVYYIILEERIGDDEIEIPIVRPCQTKKAKKLSVFVRDMMKVQRAAHPKEIKLQRNWAWPSLVSTPRSTNEGGESSKKEKQEEKITQQNEESTANLIEMQSSNQ